MCAGVVQLVNDRRELEEIVTWVDRVLEHAVELRASDIHFERSDEGFSIRLRVDGVFRSQTAPRSALAQGVLSRIKVLAHCNIAENQQPQEGVIRRECCGHSVEFRVSVLPTPFGESVVLRVLDGLHEAWELEALGMDDATREKLNHLFEARHGLFLVTGPTGSGKTTTLYSILRSMNNPSKKLITAEDPVECVLPGVTQVAVHHRLGFGFGEALRAFLRHDPDVILVGEIRDPETARVAVQASLTGHWVMSTLHTACAPSAIPRLMDLGLEPQLVAASLSGVLAQRLVRRICDACRATMVLDDAVKNTFRASGIELQAFYGKGCPICEGEGYRGRSAIFEWMPMSDELRSLTLSRVPLPTLRRCAIEEGMQELLDDGVRAVMNGVTTIDEIMLVSGRDSC